MLDRATLDPPHVVHDSPEIRASAQFLEKLCVRGVTTHLDDMEARKCINFGFGQLSGQICTQIKIKAIVQHSIAVLVPVSYGRGFPVSGNPNSQDLSPLQAFEYVVQVNGIQVQAGVGGDQAHAIDAS
jgi:hypothetical protein